MLQNILWGILNICDLHLIKSQSVYVDLSMPEDKKRAQQKYKTMEVDILQPLKRVGVCQDRADASFFEVLQSLFGRPKD